MDSFCCVGLGGQGLVGLQAFLAAQVDCPAGPSYSVKFTNDSGSSVRYSLVITDATVDGSVTDDTTGSSDTVANAATLTLTAGGSDLREYTLRFQRTTGFIFFTTYTGTVHLMADGAPLGDATKCKFQGEAQSATTSSGGFIFLP